MIGIVDFHTRELILARALASDKSPASIIRQRKRRAGSGSGNRREKGLRRPSGRYRVRRLAARQTSGQDRANLYSEITDKIITELEAGRIPWVQPWGSGSAKAPIGMPRNATTGRAYSGINILMLWASVIENRFSTQSRLTFRQAAAGGNVRKGERSTMVVYANRFVPVE